jgi:hypothetical protein
MKAQDAPKEKNFERVKSLFLYIAIDITYIVNAVSKNVDE